MRIEIEYAWILYAQNELGHLRDNEIVLPDVVKIRDTPRLQEVETAKAFALL